MDFKQSIIKYLKENAISNIDITTALIDMDGVLYDSMKNHTAAWFRMAQELGIECCHDEFYLYEGMTGIATINLLFKRAFNKEITPDEARELYKKKAKYFIEMGEPTMMPHANDMLQILLNSNITPVLVTGSGQNSILERISNDYPGVFSDSLRVTAHDVTHGKPHPEPYLKGMKLAHSLPYNSIVIENAPLGVTAGHAAGCFTIALTTGPIPEVELWNAGANIVFPSMREFALQLPELINCFNNTNIKL